MEHDTYRNHDWPKQVGDAVATNYLQIRTTDLDILGGTILSYHHSPWPPSSSKPTVVLIPDFATTVDIFRYQLADAELTEHVNLLAIEHPGHGKTRIGNAGWTEKDAASVTLAGLDAFKLTDPVFVAGLGQGGRIAAQLALMAPDRIAGLIPISTSLDAEDTASRDSLTTTIDKWSSPDAFRLFQPDAKFLEEHVLCHLGPSCSQADQDFWTIVVKKNWCGEDGRKRAHMAAVSLRDHEPLLESLDELKCPILWLQGGASEGAAHDAKQQTEKLGSAEKRLEILADASRALPWSGSAHMNKLLLEFVQQYATPVGKTSTP